MKSKKILSLLLIGLIVPILSGCALLPYSSNYSCPEAKSGMGNCSSIETNYKLSTGQIKTVKKASVHCPVSLRHTNACESYGSGINAVSVKRAVKTAGYVSVSNYLLKYMLKTSTPPLYVPSVIKKVWILPYSTTHVFHSGEDIYIVVKKGHWLYGNYIYKKLNRKYDMFTIRR